MPEDDQTATFSQYLVLSGKFWVFKIMDPSWPNIIAHYLWKYLDDDEDLDEDELQSSYLIRHMDIDHYLISKKHVPAQLLAKMLNKSVGAIHQAAVIELGKIPLIGDPEAVPNVSYCGIA